MEAKCVHNDLGFCKFREDCRFYHPTQVCRNRVCQNRSCPKRHPRPCRNQLLKKHCRFGNNCKYEHSYECELCDNLKYLVDKEAGNAVEKLKKKDETIAKMTLEILNLKKDKKDLEQELTASKSKNEKLLVENRKSNDEKTKLKESFKEYKQQAEYLKSTEKLKMKELQEAKETIGKMDEIQKKNEKETQVLTVDLEEKNVAVKSLEDEIKLKNQEIKSLVLTRKVCLDNASKLQIANNKLEDDMKELRLKKTAKIGEIKLPYPCDKCNFTFKTAALLVKHVKKEHGNLPEVRP